MRTDFVIAGLLACLVAGEDAVIDWSEDWEERVNQGMTFCDKDGGGTISYKEFVKCSKELGNEKDIERDFERYDLNGDSKIDHDEAYLVTKRKDGPQPSSLGDENFESIFNWIDDDGNSKLSWSEFKSCWDPLYSDWDYRMLTSTFKNADFDNDAELDYSEAYAEYEAQSTLDRKFNVVDANDDGKIEMKEWSNNLLFMSKTSNTAVIRERFGYHDENGDGVLSRNELYHVIRPN